MRSYKIPVYRGAGGGPLGPGEDALPRQEQDIPQVSVISRSQEASKKRVACAENNAEEACLSPVTNVISNYVCPLKAPRATFWIGMCVRA